MITHLGSDILECEVKWALGNITTNKASGKRWEYQTTSPASREICMQVKKQQLQLVMEQQTGSKLAKEYERLYIFTLLI